MSGLRSQNMIRNAVTMMAGTLASRVLGLLREVITAACFGAGRSLDAFFVAYTIANLGRQLLAEGALSAAFVPVFAQALERDGFDRAKVLARQASAVILAAVCAAVCAGIAVSPWLVSLIAPGLTGAAAASAVTMTRALFPFLIVISAAALVMGALNSLGSFFVPALAPALSNAVFIAVVALTASRLGVQSLVRAVLLGGAANLTLQWLWLSRRHRFTLLPAMPRRDDSDLRRMCALFLPCAAGLSLNQLNPVLGRFFGSFLGDGAISMLNYSNRVIQLPLGLVVIAVSQAVLPELSRCARTTDGAFPEVLGDALKFSLFVILPVALVTMLLSDEIVHLLFVRGAFGARAWHGTAGALFWSAAGLPGMACTTVVMRALFAKGLARQAGMTTLSSVAGTVVFSWALAEATGLNGLALAGSLAFTLSSVTGLALLRRSLSASGGLARQFSALWAAKTAAGCVASAVPCLLARQWLPYPAEASLFARLLWLLAAGGSGGALYALSTLVMRCDEWKLILPAIHLPCPQFNRKEAEHAQQKNSRVPRSRTSRPARPALSARRRRRRG